MKVTAKEAYRDPFRAGLTPDPVLTVSEWADRHRVLAQKAAAEPGPWRTSRTPYLREIMDCLSASSPVEEVVFMKGAQVGGSECGFNWIGYAIDQAPGPMMLIQPTVDLAKRNSKQRIAPLIDECPRLRHKVRDGGEGESSNTLLSKEFPGGMLLMTGANSATGLRSVPARYVMFDETDAYPLDVDGEGDPIELATARTRTFARRKLFKVSTPTFDGISRIQFEYEQSDKRRYHVPCPHCEHIQWLRWEQVKWPKDEPEKAFYECESCADPIEEHHKTWMLEHGKWVAENPSSTVAGFHLSSLYSPLGWFSWGDAAKKFLKDKGDQEKLRVFINTVLGEVWKSKGDAPDWKALYDRREAYEIGKAPREVCFLTAGADVQKDRIEVEIVGWGPFKESWSVDYRVFMGDTSTGSGAPWEELDKLLNEKIPHASGSLLDIRILAIDSGYNTQVVYNWARKHPSNRVIAIKGSDDLPVLIGQPKAVDINIRGQRIARGFRVWPVGVNLIKTELYGWLKLEKPLDGEFYPPGYCHFPQYEDEHFQQLTAEQVVKRIVNGFATPMWEKIRPRNERLDARVYARAAASLFQMDRFKLEHWEKLASQVGATPPRRSSNHTQPNSEKRNQPNRPNKK